MSSSKEDAHALRYAFDMDLGQDQRPPLPLPSGAIPNIRGLVRDRRFDSDDEVSWGKDEDIHPYLIELGDLWDALNEHFMNRERGEEIGLNAYMCNWDSKWVRRWDLNLKNELPM